MKKDLHIIRDILNRFLESDTTFIYFEDLDPRPVDEFMEDQAFFTNLLLVFESGLVSNKKGLTEPLEQLGIHQHRHGFIYSNVQLRLTDQGHELATALNQKTTFEKLKSGAAALSMPLLIELSKELLKKSFF